MTEDDTTRRDDELLALLAAAVRSDGPPDSVVAAANAAFAWRTIDAELAALTYDSLDDRELAGVRGMAAATRAITFESAQAVIEVEVAEAGSARRLEGQVVPPQVANLELHRIDTADAVALRTDELGRFRAEGVRPGRLRLLCRFLDQVGGGTLLTEWVLI